MQQKCLAIYDGERSYCSALAGRLSSQEYMPYEVCAFTEEEALRNYQKTNTIDILLVSEEQYRPHLLDNPMGQILLLKERNEEKEYEEPVTEIPRYQSVQGIYRSIMRYADVSVQITGKGENEGILLGFFSPVKRCLQTTLALEMGRKLAKKGKTLYLSFECFSSLEKENPFEPEGDLTDLIYYMDCAKAQFPSRMESLVHSIGGVDVIYAPRSFVDLDHIEREKWEELLSRIRKLGKYRYILLDLCEQVQGIFQILEECQKIFTIQKKDPISRRKIGRYEELLKVTGHGALSEKTSYLTLPAVSFQDKWQEEGCPEIRQYLETEEGSQLWSEV